MRIAALTAALLIALVPCRARAWTSGTQRISGAAISTLAGKALARFTRDAAASYVPAAAVADQLVSGGHVHLRAQSPMGTSSFVNVPVQIEVDGRLDRTVFVGYRAQIFIETAVASHDLAPGTVLAPEDLKLARVAFYAPRTRRTCSSAAG
ncbi:MAG: SAF domain-containing protein [Candidatus Baltobacteraceae bacterium]